MHLRTYSLNKEQSLILVAVIIIFTAAMVYLPMKTLRSEYYYNRMTNDLDDSSTEYIDVIPISGDSIAHYNKAIRSLEKASAILPTETMYLKALADIYARLGKWQEVMDVLDETPRKDAPPFFKGGVGGVLSEDPYPKAIASLNKATSLEPTNPDYHLALGQLYDEINKTSDADKEFTRAIKAYPINAPLRYELAIHCLNTGRKGDALEHARILAGIDTSYILPDSAKNRQMAERNMPSYTAILYNSYLFKALEIGWRVSRDTEAVKGIAPDNPDADEVVRLFMESKGVEE